MCNYEINFRVSPENSGKATYMAKRFESYTSPYQVDCGNNRYEQNFLFKHLEELIKFVKSAFEEFGADFEVTCIKFRNDFK